MKLKEYDTADFLTDNELRKEYLNQVLADGDLNELKRAIFNICKSYGVENIAKKAKINRVSIYKMFRQDAKPRFETMLKIINAFDFKLAVK